MSVIQTRTELAIAITRAINENGGVNPEVFEISENEYCSVLDSFKKDRLRILSAPIGRQNFIILGIPVVARKEENGDAVGNAVKLVPFDDQNKLDAVRILKDALSRAETGDVLGVIIVTKDSDGMWSHQTTASLSIREEIGAIECLKWDRINRSHN